jgi:transmembrane sensor
MSPDAYASGPFEDGIADEASVWLARRDRGLSAAEKREFDQWMAVSLHAAEFDRIEQTWRDLDQVKADVGLAEMGRRLDQATCFNRSHRLMPYWAALTAAAAAAIVIGLWLRPRPAAAPSSSTIAPAAPLAYRVVPSAAHTLKLPDGSTVELRGESVVTTAFTPGTRRLTLVRGEAHFHVTKNPARPFIVSVGGVAVRAVGTAFDVQFSRIQVQVIVTEGKVTVEDLSTTKAPPAVPLLLAGERAVISENGPPGSRPMVQVAAITPAQTEQVLAWRNAWLIFDRTPLDQAIAAFNAQSSQRIVLGDAALADRRLGGMFRADNVDSFVRLLEQGVDVRSERRGEHEIVLLPVRP